ncbi:MAG: hydantoinase/oxoprolinase family protein [Oscillospiraceae bacterium]|nr:hydantoinase/oxoprolinase family protein [Oscillospiraceae bacterium]
MRIGIGIDTGGTYTDAAAYDLEGRRVLGTAKARTTREDLCRGILEALDGLPPETLGAAELIALSTTLATNACVEDRLGRTRLILLGADRRVLARCGAEYGLPPLEEMVLQESGTDFYGAVDGGMDWDRFREQLRRGFSDLDAVGIVEQNAMRNGAVIEKQAKSIFSQLYDLPAVCGHELFSELNCLQRAASVLLNAGLLRCIDEFLNAMDQALRRRGVHAAVAVVRSDGSLASREFAAARPVETLLSGPAASVLGGSALTGEENCVVVDMGGTTTDLALVSGGAPVTELDGIRVGRWRTYVDGLCVKTFGLGGDSAIHCRDGAPLLEAYRVQPLCVAAQKHPVILRNLRALTASGARHTRPLHEHVLLQREPEDAARWSETERQLCAALRAGPLSLADAAAAAGTDVYNLDLRRLLRGGVVQVCGLTPTDIMHLRGDFTAYDAEAARLAAQYVADNAGMRPETLCGWVYQEMERRIYRAVVELLLERRDPRLRRRGVGEDLRRLIDDSFDQKPGWVLPQFRTDFTLLGIGAPIHLFLPAVAERLGTRAVIPPHAGVANALGAVVGGVTDTAVVEIRENGIDGYTVYGPAGARSFPELPDAERCALEAAEAAARAGAVRRGAQEPVTVRSEVQRTTCRGGGGELFLGARAVARAAGALKR